MGIVFRQSVKSTIVIFTGAIIGALTTYLCTLILSKAELGFFTNIIYLGATIHMFALLGTGSVLAVFIQKYGAEDEKRKVLVALSLITTLVASAIITILLLVFKGQFLALYKPDDRVFWDSFYYWIPVLTLLWGIMALFEHYLLSQTKVAISAFVKEILIRLINLLSLGLLYWGIIDFFSFILINIFGYGLAAIVLFLVSYRTQNFGFSFRWTAFTKGDYKEIIHFAWYHLLLVVSINLMNYIDTLMLAPLDESGMESIAAYRVALFIATVMVMPFRAMTGSSYASLNSAYIDNDLPRLRDLFSRAGVNILIASVGMLIIIGNNLDNAVAILPKGYEVVKPIVLILMLGRLIDVATGLNNEMISISKYYKFNFRLSIMLILLVITLDRMLIPKYGVYGAAWGSTIALSVFNIIKLVYLWRKMNLHPLRKGTLYVFVAGFAAGGIGYILPFMYHPLIDCTIRTLITSAVYIVLLLWWKPSPDITTYLNGVRRNRRLY